MKKILFVCTGNTCRSCMAEAMLRQLLKSSDMAETYEVSSAGTSVFFPQPASGHALEALQELGIDMSGHVSRQVTMEMLEEADLVLTMTAAHKQYLLSQAPSAWKKTFTLVEYCNEGVGTDIMDPFGGDLETYLLCRDEIMQSLLKLFDILKNKELERG